MARPTFSIRHRPFKSLISEASENHAFRASRVGKDRLTDFFDTVSVPIGVRPGLRRVVTSRRLLRGRANAARLPRRFYSSICMHGAHLG
jgi:hypothetical protein